MSQGASPAPSLSSARSRASRLSALLRTLLPSPALADSEGAGPTGPDSCQHGRSLTFRRQCAHDCVPYYAHLGAEAGTILHDTGCQPQTQSPMRARLMHAATVRCGAVQRGSLAAAASVLKKLLFSPDGRLLAEDRGFEPVPTMLCCRACHRLQDMLSSCSQCSMSAHVGNANVASTIAAVRHQVLVVSAQCTEQCESASGSCTPRPCVHRSVPHQGRAVCWKAASGGEQPRCWALRAPPAPATGSPAAACPLRAGAFSVPGWTRVSGRA